MEKSIKKEVKVSSLEMKYKAADKAGKRVLVARDIIEALNTKVYKAKRGMYVGVLDKMSGDANIKKEYEKIHDCRVCAVGACILSITKFQNNLLVSDVDGSGYDLGTNQRVSKLLKSVFTNNQLFLIEEAFEVRNGTRISYHLPGSISDEVRELARAGYLKFRKIKDHKLRMEAIMKNIIKNKGEFIP